MPRSWSDIVYLQGSVPFLGGAPTGTTTTGNGFASSTQGVDAAQQVEIQETAGGTATINLEGSLDGTTWYAVGYQQVDSTASPARAAAPISVLANAKHVYQVLDPYPQLRARISAIAAATILVRLYSIGS